MPHLGVRFHSRCLVLAAMIPSIAGRHCANTRTSQRSGQRCPSSARSWWAVHRTAEAVAPAFGPPDRPNLEIMTGPAHNEPFSAPRRTCPRSRMAHLTAIIRAQHVGPLRPSVRPSGMSPTPHDRRQREHPGASAIVAGTPSTPLQMQRYDRRAYWPYDRVDEGLTKTRRAVPGEVGGPGGGRVGAPVG